MRLALRTTVLPMGPAAAIVLSDDEVAALGGGAVGGHNPLEPARLGKPVVTGPDASNWTGVTRMLKQSGGLISVLSPAELPGIVGPLLADPDAARDMGERARRAAAEAASNGDFSPLWCGQNASGCRAIPAGEITRALAAGLAG